MIKILNKSFLYQIISILGNEINKVPFLLILILLSSLIEIIGIGLIAPYVSLIIMPEVFLESKFYSYVSFLNLPRNINDLIILIGIILIIIFLIKFLFAFTINKIILRFAADQGSRLCIDLMNSYQNMNYSNYILRNSSEYLYSINTLSLNFALVFQACLRFVSESIVAIFIFILLATSNIYILSILALVIICAIFFYDKFFKNSILKYASLRHTSMNNQLKAVNEGILGIKEIRMLAKEDFFHSRVKKCSTDYANYYVITNLISTSPRYFLEILMISFIVLIIFINIQIGNDLTKIVPTLAIFGIASIRLLPTASQLMTSIALIRNGKEGVDMIYNDLNNINNKKISQKSLINDKKFESLKLLNVSFSYPESKLMTCKNISIDINKGECIGVIGASGAGKTTLIDLMLGLLSPQSGEIKFNEVSIEKNLQEWMSKIAYLPQEIFVLDDSIKKNISLVDDVQKIDNDKLDKSIRQSKLIELIEDLPDGLDTIIGERGIRLSGGQRQRIAIARAFYHEREVLVFDEATSSLDTNTESEIMEEIKQLKGLKTMIIITHRLQTVKNCDRVYQIENGQILKSGKFDEVVN